MTTATWEASLELLVKERVRAEKEARRKIRHLVASAIRSIRLCKPGSFTEGVKCGRAAERLLQARDVECISPTEFQVLNEFIFHGRGQAQRMARDIREFGRRAPV